MKQTWRILLILAAFTALLCCAQGVVIPSGVTVIAEDAFAGSRVRYIYGYAWSEAQYFAERQDEDAGIRFVEIDDEWIAEHTRE